MPKIRALKKLAEKLGITLAETDDSLAKILRKVSEEYEPPEPSEPELPEVTEEDNGKVLMVANGVWGKGNVNFNNIVAFCPLVGDLELVYDLTDKTSYYAVPENFKYPPFLALGEGTGIGNFNINCVCINVGNGSYLSRIIVNIEDDKYTTAYELEDEEEHTIGFKLVEHTIGDEE